MEELREIKSGLNRLKWKRRRCSLHEVEYYFINGCRLCLFASVGREFEKMRKIRNITEDYLAKKER
jgi:hypothetical protein